jgi:hypothetical protein
MIEEYKFNAAIGVNNVGNAFTPYGSCDPLNLASFGVGVYQAGTRADADMLLQCVSSRAKLAIGLSPKMSCGLEIQVGDRADFVLFGSQRESKSFRSRKTIQELVYDAGNDRVTIFHGNVVSRAK